MGLIKGNGIPSKTTKGSIGDTYVDLNSGKLYKCIFSFHDSFGGAEYEWKYDGEYQTSDAVVEKERNTAEVESQKDDREDVNRDRPRNNYQKQYNKQYRQNRN